MPPRLIFHNSIPRNIDTWLMSCRVLGRKVEEAVLNVLCSEARRRGINQLIGTYIPTERNALVEDHYAKLGFLPVDTRAKTAAPLWQPLNRHRRAQCNRCRSRCAASGSRR